MAAAVASLNATFDMIAGSFRRPAQDEASAISVSPQDSPCLSKSSKSAVGGVGITFSKDELGNFVVRSLQAGSGAAASGIQPGDVIVSVDDIMTEKMGIRQVASAISGPVDSHVALTIRRGSQTGKVELVRMSGLLKGVVAKNRSLFAQPSPLSSATGLSRRTHESAFSSHRVVAASSNADADADVQPYPSPSTVTSSQANIGCHSATATATAVVDSVSQSPPHTPLPLKPSVVTQQPSSSEFNQEVHSFARPHEAVSFAPHAPLISVASLSDGIIPPNGLKPRPTSSSAFKHFSKEFESSEFFLAVKDAKALNAIVAADCRHLIDDLTSPDAFANARQRLIASRSRLPMADMKKVILPPSVIYLLARASLSLSKPFFSTLFFLLFRPSDRIHWRIKRHEQ
jgi:hypothetical protein